MKRGLVIFLLLCLALSAWAHAAEDIPLARWGNDGINDHIYWQFAHKDELVLVGAEALYTWRAGDANLQTWPWADGSLLTGEGAFSTMSALAAFTGGKEIYLVVPDAQEAVLSRVSRENGTARLEALYALDWEPVCGDDEESGNFLPRLDSCAYVDGYLYGYQHEVESVFAIPVDGGETEVLEDIWNIIAMCPYKDNQVLFVQLNPTDDAARLISWDMRTEESEELGSIPYPEGIAYDAQADRLLYVYQNAVYTFDFESGEMSVINSMYTNGTFGTSLSDGYYACTGETNTILKSTDPDAIEARRLSIRTMFGDTAPVTAARDEFALARPDVELSLYDGRGDTGGDGFIWYVDNYTGSELVEELLTQSADYDIYIGSLTNEALNAVYNRGYMYPITGSEKIDALFADMRPVFVDALNADGAPIAVPLETKGTTIALHRKALEQLGLTVEDFPTNWLDLLDMLSELAPRFDEANVILFSSCKSVEEVRNQLVDLIFRTYENHVQYEQLQNPQAPIDNTSLLAVLEKLDSMDLNVFDTETYGTGLLCFDSATTSQGRSSINAPILMSLTPDEPCFLPVRLTVAFINPYSPNKDLAVEFLECALDHLENGVLADLMVEEVLPKDMETYEKVHAAAERTLENAKTRLAEETEQANLPRLIDAVHMYELELDRLDLKYYQYDPSFAPWYRANADNIIVLHYNMLTDHGRPSAEIEPIVSKYKQGAIGAAEMVQEFERKVDMMIREGN